VFTPIPSFFVIQLSNSFFKRDDKDVSYELWKWREEREKKTYENVLNSAMETVGYDFFVRLTAGFSFILFLSFLFILFLNGQVFIVFLMFSILFLLLFLFFLIVGLIEITFSSYPDEFLFLIFPILYSITIAYPIIFVQSYVSIVSEFFCPKQKKGLIYGIAIILITVFSLPFVSYLSTGMHPVVAGISTLFLAFNYGIFFLSSFFPLIGFVLLRLTKGDIKNGFIGTLPILSLIIILFSAFLIHSSIAALSLFISAISFFLILKVFDDVRFFSKMKSWYLKKYLEWKGFEKFLREEVMIKRYKYKDMGMMNDFLIYGTALGCFDNPLEILED